MVSHNHFCIGTLPPLLLLCPRKLERPLSTRSSRNQRMGRAWRYGRQTRGQSACPKIDQVNGLLMQMVAGRHTGTFFCDSTTAQFFPLTPTEVMFAAVIALKAYSNGLSRKLFYPAVCAGSMGPTPILLAMLRDLKGFHIRGTYQLDRVCLDPRI